MANEQIQSWYEKKEQDICNLLCPVDAEGNKLNLAYNARPLPDNQNDYIKNFDKTMVYVVCIGGDFDSNESTSTIIQEETVVFELQIRAASRKGEKGVFCTVEDIRRKLLGYKFPGAKKITFSKLNYIDGGTQNDWNYSISLNIQRKVIECLPEPDAPLSKNIDFDTERVN